MGLAGAPRPSPGAPSQIHQNPTSRFDGGSARCSHADSCRPPTPRLATWGCPCLLSLAHTGVTEGAAALDLSPRGSLRQDSSLFPLSQCHRPFRGSLWRGIEPWHQGGLPGEAVSRMTEGGIEGGRPGVGLTVGTGEAGPGASGGWRHQARHPGSCACGALPRHRHPPSWPCWPSPLRSYLPERPPWHPQLLDERSMWAGPGSTSLSFAGPGVRVRLG